MIAVFDLDHTLLCANSSYCFGAFLFKRKKISIFQAFVLIVTYALHKINWVSIETVHQQAFKWIFFKKSNAEIKAFVEVFLDENLEKMIRPSVLHRLQEHKSQKFKTYLYSSSPSFIVESVAQRLGFDHTLSSQYLVDKEGKFAKILLLVNGDEKEKQLKCLVAERNEAKVFTTAYSDSFLDAALLLLVDKPVCVNPDKQLRELAERSRWEIIQDGSSFYCS